MSQYLLDGGMVRKPGERRPNYKCNCMTMMATVDYVDWRAAAATTEATATLTARGTQRRDVICSVTVHIWFLWT